MKKQGRKRTEEIRQGGRTLDNSSTKSSKEKFKLSFSRRRCRQPFFAHVGAEAFARLPLRKTL